MFNITVEDPNATDETDPVVSASGVSGLQSAAFDLTFTVTEDNLPSAAPYGITVTGAPDAATGMYTIGAVMMGADAITIRSRLPRQPTLIWSQQILHLP